MIKRIGKNNTGKAKVVRATRSRKKLLYFGFHKEISPPYSHHQSNKPSTSIT